MRKWKPVADFDPNSQDPDPPGRRYETPDAVRISGPGQIGGGSKSTPQVSRMKSGKGTLSGSHPKSPQRLRG